MTHKRWILIIGLATILPLELDAQRFSGRLAGVRTAQVGGHVQIIPPMGNPVPPMMSPVAPMLSPLQPFVPVPGTNFIPGNSLNVPGNFMQGRFPRRFGPVFSVPFYAPVPYDVYAPGPYDVVPPEAGGGFAEEPGISTQLDRLTNELSELRQELRQSGQRATPAPPPAPVEDTPVENKQAAVETRPATVFVLSDGSRIEVENYAFADDMLWIFAGRNSKQIPAAQINFDATERANRERGVRFVRPSRDSAQ